MMTDLPAIEIKNLSKCYHLRKIHHPDNLRDVLANSFSRIFSHCKNEHTHSQTLWALQDVNLKIVRGETVGIIGKNGAGKSTLLKILSRVTEPTIGEAHLAGRVAALLEVGIGFHPDLTGRENIFLNAAILGMKRSEILKRFAQICNFAEIGSFIDYPVKKYSSGMYVRLAFAIAAHLDAEILLIDEVLAVGDTAFQQKCLNKIQTINQRGHTVIFVSHNLPAIERLCNRCLVLHAGKIVFDGATPDALKYYRSQILTNSTVTATGPEKKRATNDLKAFISNAMICDLDNRPVTNLPAGKGCQINFTIQRSTPLIKPNCTIYWRNPALEGQIVLRLATRDVGFQISSNANLLHVSCRIPALNLLPQRYTLDFHLYEQPDTLDYLESALSLEIIASDVYGSGTLPDSRYGGIVFVHHQWQMFEE